jgi:TonB-linked SusC/RagA family outer membrane protein
MKKFDCKILSGLQKLRKAGWWKVMRIVLFFITMSITQSFALGNYAHATRFSQVSQQRTVSGKVTDSGGQPLPGVTVVVKGTTQGTITDTDGNYSLTNIPQDARLVFSFVGMRTQEIAITGRTTINVAMEEETIGLEEVVAIGYGTQKKETITGSVSAVKGEQLAKTTIANVSNTLAGQLPGLIALQSNGMPGRDAAMLSIRGFGNALFIVDGIEADISTLDPNSIESVSILKDGAASIYGSRAGNGVILVTTKRGNIGKPSFTLNSSYNMQGLTRFPDKASSGQYTEMMSEQAINSGMTPPYTPEQIQNYYNEVDPYLFPNTDWEKVLLRTWAPQQQHNLSVQGGSDKIKYYGFIGYLNQETMFKNHGGEYSRINLQSNIDAQITDQFSAQFDFASINEIRLMPQQSLFGVAAEGGTVWDHYWSDLPIYPAELPDPTKYSYNGSNGQTQILSNREIFGHNDEITNDVRTTLSLKYEFKFVEGLSAKAFLNGRQIYREFEYFQKPAYFYTYDPTNDTYTLKGGFTDKALMAQQRNTDRVFTGQFSLNYDRIFNDIHHVTGLVLYEAIDYSGNNLSAGRTNFLTPAIEQLFAGSTEGMNNYGSGYEMGRKSIVARANYSYKNKYLLETSFRADASAKFPPEKRWGYFPSVSLGWIMTEEEFMKDAGALEHLKLRGSYGQSGNDAVGNFQYLAGYEYGHTHVFDKVEQGIVSTGLANPNLTWEKIAISNVGADISFWNRKLYGETDVFYRTRKGIIGNRLTTLPSTFGAELPPENLNSISDRGFEFKLGTADNIADFRYDVSANVSWSRAKWDYFEEPIYEDPDQARIYTQTGRWIDRMYGYVSEGLFESQAEIDALPYDQDGQGNATLRPGDIRYKDINEDKKIDWRDQVEIGNGNIPHWMYGFNFNLSYKNFDLSGIIQGAAGYHVRINMIFNSAQYYNNRWTEKNKDRNSIVPRLGGAPTNWYGSDHNYKSADYLRLKSINFGYNLPRFFLEKIKLEQCRIYVAGTNLLTLDKLKKYGMDPEAPSAFSGLYYPQQRTISFGLNLTL